MVNGGYIYVNVVRDYLYEYCDPMLWETETMEWHTTMNNEKLIHYKLVNQGVNTEKRISAFTVESIIYNWMLIKLSKGIFVRRKHHEQHILEHTER